MPAEPQAAFFSYSHDDSKFVLRLAEDLKAAGANVWLDQLDIEAGQNWPLAVQDALTNSPRVLVVLSPSAVRSPHVMNEVTFALEEQKRVIPVLHFDCTIPLQLRGLHYADFRSDSAQGLKVLLRALGVQQPAVAASGAAVSAVPKDTAVDVPDADERERSTEPQRLEQEEEQAAEQARQGKRERQRKAADRPQKTGLERAVPEGVYLDPETNLMWTTRDNGEDIDWQQANKYAGQSRLGGYSDWRLPTIDELEKLYDPQNFTNRYIRKPFRLTGSYAWSSTKKGSRFFEPSFVPSAWRFHFSLGRRVVYPMGASYSARALCVRRSGE